MKSSDPMVSCEYAQATFLSLVHTYSHILIIILGLGCHYSLNIQSSLTVRGEKGK